MSRLCGAQLERDSSVRGTWPYIPATARHWSLVGPHGEHAADGRSQFCELLGLNAEYERAKLSQPFDMCGGADNQHAVPAQASQFKGCLRVPSWRQLRLGAERIGEGLRAAK